VIYSGNDMLRRQRSEVLAGVSNAKPLQEAPRTQKSAIAGLRLETTHLAQIRRELISKS
jgi:hypothetical protein